MEKQEQTGRTAEEAQWVPQLAPSCLFQVSKASGPTCELARWRAHAFRSHQNTHKETTAELKWSGCENKLVIKIILRGGIPCASGWPNPLRRLGH